MITYNQLGAKVSILLNQPFNHELNERIKDSFKFILATRIRQSVQQYGIDQMLKVNYALPLEKYNPIQDITNLVLQKQYNVKDIKYRLRTIDKVLRPVRFLNEAPFTKVSTIDGIGIPYINVNESIYSTNNKFSSSLGYYIENDYIIVVSRKNDKLPKIGIITIESIFEDSDKVLSYYNDILADEDAVIPMPYDMINSIASELLKTEFGIIKNDPIEIKLDNKESTQQQIR
jgi:hypothetical protein